MLNFIKTKPKWLLTLIAALIIFIPVTAYALTSSDFASLANTWVSNNCKTVNPNYKQKMTVCYNYFRNQEQDAQISGQQQSISDLQNNAKSVWAFDNNNQKLGILLDPNLLFSGTARPTQIYNPEMQKILVIDNDSNDINLGINVSFTGPNCTGASYIKTNGDNSILNRYNDRLLTDSNHNYWTFEDNPSINYVQMSTLMAGTSCISDNSLWPAIKINSVNSPIHFPLAIPLSFKYQ